MSFEYELSLPDDNIGIHIGTYCTDSNFVTFPTFSGTTNMLIASYLATYLPTR